MTVEEPTHEGIGTARGRRLLRIARQAVEEAWVQGGEGSPPSEEPMTGEPVTGEPVTGESANDARPEAWLEESRATFVSLHHRNGELRGCIGSLEPRRPLAEDVANNARAAAFHDPRFAPVERHELPELVFEVSVLGRLEPLPARDRDSVVAALRPGVDGLLLVSGMRRATFLPQVWSSVPTPEAFLAALERKAGLPGGDWPAGTRCWRYRVEEFEEGA